jgi:hypothetical protein
MTYLKTSRIQIFLKTNSFELTKKKFEDKYKSFISKINYDKFAFKTFSEKKEGV